MKMTTEDEKPKFARGRQRDILTYIFDQPAGKHITITELEKKFGGRYTHNQIMASMSYVVGIGATRYNVPVKRVTTGVWQVIDGKTVTAEVVVSAKQRTEMYVEILKERDTHLIVEDVEDGKIYKMTLVG